jgi:undecaprenyl-diphosphatase
MAQEPEPHRPLRRALLATLLLALAGLVALRLAYEHEPLQSVDGPVAEWVAANMPGWAETVGKGLSWIGAWTPITVLTAVVVVLLVRVRAWVDAAFVLMAVIGSQVIVTGLKAWIDRPRPDVGSAVPLPETAAFPSGHATSGIAVFGAFAVVGSDHLPAGRARTLFWIAVVLVGLGTGLSRLVLNVHWVSDILAGWCLGLAWLAACLLVRDGLARRFDRA